MKNLIIVVLTVLLLLLIIFSNTINVKIKTATRTVINSIVSLMKEEIRETVKEEFRQILSSSTATGGENRDAGSIKKE